MADKGNRSLKVGVFVASLLAAMGAVLFVAGGATDLLKRYYTLNAAWEDVSGSRRARRCVSRWTWARSRRSASPTTCSRRSSSS